ncbi:MAG: NgoPII family restriction endonuclease [Clostridiaceae bacterium]|jgi:hypothetical protein|nr:NgoPII family restriction endonuclease [Clostridiaceae bacterium]
MSNLLVAIQNIRGNLTHTVKDYTNSRNRMNNTGEAFELFIKDSFCNSYKEDTASAFTKYSETLILITRQSSNVLS